MQISEYKNIFENEGEHFFYEANHRIVLSLLKKYSQKKARLKILDAGCGTGLLSKKLEKYGDVTGLDFSPEALKFARKRRVKTKLGSVTKIPFKASTFDAAVCVDVIYHSSIKDDIAALKELRRVLKNGGMLILRVPANRWLHLEHDKHVHTRERYTKSLLKRKLKTAKFNLIHLSYVNAILLPLAMVKQFIEVFVSSKGSGVEKIPSVINSFLKAGLRFELLFVMNETLPFGLGIIAVARK